MGKDHQRLRVAHLTHAMDIGGTEQVIRQLCLGLDPSRHENHVICIDGHIGEIGQQLADAGMPLHRLSRQPGFDRQLLGALRDLLHELEVDVLHCHQYTPFSYGALASRGQSNALIFTEHGRFHPDRYSWKRRLINPWLARRCSAITAISEATCRALAEFEWIPASRIQCIYNAIRDPLPVAALDTVDQQMARSGEPHVCVFGTVSRLDPIKNQRMMLEAFAQLGHTSSPTRLLIVGDGPERAALEQLATDLELQDRVTFTGFRTEPLPWLDAMDVFLLPSFSEGTSMTLLESMALHKPSIVTRVGGNPEIVLDGQTGLLIDSGDTAGLAQAMRELANNADQRRALGDAARQRFESTFTIERMVEAFAGIYQDAVRQRVSLMRRPTGSRRQNQGDRAA